MKKKTKKQKQKKTGSKDKGEEMECQDDSLKLATYIELEPTNISSLPSTTHVKSFFSCS